MMIQYNGQPWTVLDARTSEPINNVIWADTDTCLWCQVAELLRIDPLTGDAVTVVHRARRIEIDGDACVMLIHRLQLPPEVHNSRPIVADDCMAAVRAMCRSGA